jgi:RimJ/RimL family protein N-acetyltransferase
MVVEAVEIEAAARRYPAKVVTLNDGGRVTLRPIRPEDEPALTAFYGRLSPASAYQRFFMLMARLPPSWARFLSNVDYEKRMAIVAVDPDERLIAVARYEYGEKSTEAELAIVVEDRWQGKRLGTIMMTELLSYAEDHGIHRFRAYVLADNRRMLDIFNRVTRVLERHTEQGVTSLLLIYQQEG